MLKRKHEQKEDAVSPVIGVMLMLVVTIIIAAAVAAFAGGITGTTEETPTIMAKTEIWSPESYNYMAYGRFAMTVESVSAPIPTKYLELKTIWTDSEGNKHTTSVLPYSGNNNTNYTCEGSSSLAYYEYHSPIGYGSGIPGTGTNTGNYTAGQWFGNYQLIAGTSLATSGGYDSKDINGKERIVNNKAHSNGKHTDKDGLDAILGEDWSKKLMKGNIVTVQLIYLPTNTVIYNEEVIVK